MKKVLGVFFAILILCLNGCSDNSPRALYRSLIDSQQPTYTIYPIYMYTQNGSYSVVVTENGAVDKAVSYSEDREPSNIISLQLIEIDNIQHFLGKDLDEVEAVLGEYHVDIGSGFYIPSYFTADGYLVSFTVSDNIVSRVGKTDLLSGDSVEWYD